MELLPWERFWEDSTDIDFMRDDPDEANHPIRIRMCNEAARVGGKVLDVGAGTAIDYPRLTSHGLEYTAIEPIPKFIARARELYPDIDIRQARVWNLPFEDNSFDVVYCKGVVQHLPPGTYPEALDEMWRVTKTLMLVSTNRLFWTGTLPGITQRLKGGPYDNHYNFNEFYGHVKNRANCACRHTTGFLRPEEEEIMLKRKLAHTLFIVYDLDYWREHVKK